MKTHDAPLAPARIGILLREWRAARRLSQLDLALDAELSARHLSYIETGKAQPSREVLGRLAQALDMPLRERNALLVAAGYAPHYPESALGAPAMARIEQAIGLMLKQQEPYPAFLLNRYWDIVAANGAALRLNRFLLDGRDSPHRNMLRHVFDPQDLRAVLANQAEVAGDLLGHLHALVASSPGDAKARALLDEVLAYPGVPQRWRQREPGAAPAPLLSTVFHKNGQELRFFSTITTFGTPRDVTLDELHIESCFPLDEATATFCQTLARSE
ncbi:helix-turn-helix domain-containing protein [Massilia sp. erpn]|uniref:helix-turn-helix domain-containing protein n=1 Tax=Massilia sp. erpn TaxID=2738142 RepID=UPI002104F6A2|nr:helix-turn-helix transcriptional regulator [Massilia sp. erpn]UTY58004.1 helix-turn-helix transcriptional regulator [Massilia sp. erpn]